jgi:phosphatidylglycerophosphatase A
MKNKIAEFFATVGYIGKIKYAPGTFGSLAAFPLCYIIMHLTVYYEISIPIHGFTIEEEQITALILIELIVATLLFIIGTYSTAIYISGSDNKDPKEVVIDELVGQMLVIILSSMSVLFVLATNLPNYFDSKTIDFVLLFLLPFGLFRFFDIAKPWPINWLDQNVKGAFGVMLDDIAAAIFALAVHYVLVFFIIDLYAK